MKRFRITSAIMWAIAVLVLAACGGEEAAESSADTSAAPEEGGATEQEDGADTDTADEPEVSSEVIRVGVGIDTSYAPFFVAEDAGYFEDAGLDVELVQFERGGNAVDALAAGEVQFAGSSGITTMTQLQQNPDMQAILIYEQAGDYVKTVLRSGLQPSDITTFGIVPGLSEYGARQYLESEGVDVAGVEFVAGGPSELKDILLRGDIDGFVLWEPWPEQATEGGEGEIVGVSGDYGFEYVHWLTTTGAWLDANNDAARAFADALAQGAEDVEADPDATAALLDSAITIPPEDTLTAIEEIDFGVRGFEESDTERYDSYASFWADTADLDIDWPSNVNMEWYGA